MGSNRIRYERVHGRFGFEDQNKAGKSILDYALAFDLLVTNTFYIKEDEYLITLLDLIGVT